MSNLPLLFRCEQVVSGDGYEIEVQMLVRALLREEDGEVWITGVSPVGFAGGGLDRDAALVSFRRAWSEVILDIAHDAKSLDAFEKQCKEFRDSAVNVLTVEWEDAVRNLSDESPDTTLRALKWLCENPGNDAEDLSDNCDIPLQDAVQIVNALLGAGLLEFAE